MQINLTFDSSVNNASQRWVASIQQAAQFLDTIITDPITVNFNVGFGEYANNPMQGNTLGEALTLGYYYSYGQLVAALDAHPTSALDQKFLSTLPLVDPNNGNTWFVPAAEAKALGLVAPTSTFVDAYMGFSNTLPLYYDPNRTGIPSGSTDL